MSYIQTPSAATPRAIAKASMPHYLSLLSGAVRMRILRHLASGPQSVGDIASRLGVSIGLVSHNLRQLREAGLVTAVRRSRRRIYGLDGHLARSTKTGLRVRIDQGTFAQLDLEIPGLDHPMHSQGIIQTRADVAKNALIKRPEGSDPEHGLG